MKHQRANYQPCMVSDLAIGVIVDNVLDFASDLFKERDGGFGHRSEFVQCYRIVFRLHIPRSDILVELKRW